MVAVCHTSGGGCTWCMYVRVIVVSPVLYILFACVVNSLLTKWCMLENVLPEENLVLSQVVPVNKPSSQSCTMLGIGWQIVNRLHRSLTLCGLNLLFALFIRDIGRLIDAPEGKVSHWAYHLNGPKKVNLSLDESHMHYLRTTWSFAILLMSAYRCG
jgi:hypothetical protein